MMEWALAGLAFGFAGSVHCVGMCGPLALSLPGAGQVRWRYLAERLLYNLGRAVTYALLGGVVGALGLMVALAGYQQGLSIGVGVVMILGVAIPWVQQRLGALEQRPARLLKRVMTPLRRLYQRGGAAAMLGVGLINGLLPCGFVYAALATASTAGSVSASMLFMAAFGLGTLPAMVGVSLMERLASKTWRARVQRLVPYGVVLVGLLLVARGLSLGTFLSPELREMFGTSIAFASPFLVH